MSAGTVWPSGLRRWLQVPVRKGVGSNPTAVTFCVFAETCSRTWPAHCKARGGMILLPRSCARQEPLSAELRALKLFKWQGEWQSQHVSRDSLAEWSKALASGASP